MKRKNTYIIVLILTSLFLSRCIRKDRKEYTDMNTLLLELGKNKSIEYHKYPPRLVKMFLKMDKSNNEGLQELLALTDQFIVLHIPKKKGTSTYQDSENNIRFHLKKLSYEEMLEIEFEDIIFREFINFTDTISRNIILEIDEPGLYTIYYLHGAFSREDIMRVSKRVSPIEFLKLNRKIRNR